MTGQIFPGKVCVEMKKFRGYYFRHQNAQSTVALIPGATDEGAFIQVITDGGSRRFDFPEAEFGQTVRIGENTFGKDGVHISLPGIVGDIRYSGLTPIKYDIMGPFRFFPMECRHEIVSMRHSLSGSIEADGKRYCFDGGIGYWEGDSGRSFPKEYLWIQANDFADGSSFVLSVARIPFCGLHFQGVICVLMAGGAEYRLATYLGAKASVGEKSFTIRQHDLLLQGELISVGEGCSLAAPEKGRMQGMIKEDNRAEVHIRLCRGESVICDLTSHIAGYERYPSAWTRI